MINITLVPTESIMAGAIIPCTRRVMRLHSLVTQLWNINRNAAQYEYVVKFFQCPDHNHRMATKL